MKKKSNLTQQKQQQPRFFLCYHKTRTSKHLILLIVSNQKIISRALKVACAAAMEKNYTRTYIHVYAYTTYAHFPAINFLSIHFNYKQKDNNIWV